MDPKSWIESLADDDEGQKYEALSVTSLGNKDSDSIQQQKSRTLMWDKVDSKLKKFKIWGEGGQNFNYFKTLWQLDR